MSALSGADRRFLRGRAHALKPVVHVGQGGLTPSVIGAIDRALDDHELVKIRLHEPDDKKAAAREIAATAKAELCGVVGHTVILYRPDGDSPRLVLPGRAGG